MLFIITDFSAPAGDVNSAHRVLTCSDRNSAYMHLEKNYGALVQGVYKKKWPSNPDSYLLNFSSNFTVTVTLKS